MEERNLAHFELEVEGLKIKVSKNQLLKASEENRPIAEQNPVREIVQTVRCFVKRPDSIAFVLSNTKPSTIIGNSNSGITPIGQITDIK